LQKEILATNQKNNLNSSSIFPLSTTSEVIFSSPPDLSRSCSETSLDSNDSNNDQFLSYLDKAQFYLKQMTSGIINNPLNEGDSKQADLLLYEEGSEMKKKR